MFKPLYADFTRFVVQHLISLNPNPNANHLLKQYPDNICCWTYLSSNPNAIHLIAPLNHQKMRKQCRPFNEQLVACVLNPSRVQKMANKFKLDLVEYLELI